MITPEARRRFASDRVVVKENRIFVCDFKGGCRQGLAVHFDTAGLD